MIEETLDFDGALEVPVLDRFITSTVMHDLPIFDLADLLRARDAGELFGTPVDRVNYLVLILPKRILLVISFSVSGVLGFIGVRGVSAESDPPRMT